MDSDFNKQKVTPESDENVDTFEQQRLETNTSHQETDLNLQLEEEMECDSGSISNEVESTVCEQTLLNEDVVLPVSEECTESAMPGTQVTKQHVTADVLEKLQGKAKLLEDITFASSNLELESSTTLISAELPMSIFETDTSNEHSVLISSNILNNTDENNQQLFSTASVLACEPSEMESVIEDVSVVSKSEDSASVSADSDVKLFLENIAEKKLDLDSGIMLFAGSQTEAKDQVSEKSETDTLVTLPSENPRSEDHVITKIVEVSDPLICQSAEDDRKTAKEILQSEHTDAYQNSSSKTEIEETIADLNKEEQRTENVSNIESSLSSNDSKDTTETAALKISSTDLSHSGTSSVMEETKQESDILKTEILQVGLTEMPDSGIILLGHKKDNDLPDTKITEIKLADLPTDEMSVGTEFKVINVENSEKDNDEKTDKNLSDIKIPESGIFTSKNLEAEMPEVKYSDVDSSLSVQTETLLTETDLINAKTSESVESSPDEVSNVVSESLILTKSLTEDDILPVSEDCTENEPNKQVLMACSLEKKDDKLTIDTEVENKAVSSDGIQSNSSSFESNTDDSQSDLLKLAVVEDVKHQAQTATTDIGNTEPLTGTEDVVMKDDSSSDQYEQKEHLTASVTAETKNDNIPQDETSRTSEEGVKQENLSEMVTDQVQSPCNKKENEDDEKTTFPVKGIDEDSCKERSDTSSVQVEDVDTRSSTADNKPRGMPSIYKDEDSRASFVSGTVETDMELAADESNRPPTAGNDVEMSDFNEDSNASKTAPPQPKQGLGSGKMFPLRDIVTDETSMSSVVTADSVDSENIPLARMVDESDNFPLSSLVPYSDSMPATPASADTTSDTGPPPAKRVRHDSITSAVEDELNGFPAESLFEYQWPQDGGEWYMLQEQLSEFLGIKSFKRKYPDLYRRTADKTEKDFLRRRGAVTETQSDLGLTALRSEEVYDLMLKDYPEKYQEYANVLHEREKKTIREQHKEYGVPKLDKGKMADYIKKAVRSAAEFNSQFQRERKEERRCYFDLQTFMIHYPVTKFKKLPPELTNPGPYPVALIPGQFQNFYKRYTPAELKYLPLNTVMYDPPSNKGMKLAKPSSGEDSSEIEDNAEDKAESGSDNESDGDDSSDSGNSSSDDDDDQDEKESERAKIEICRICKEAVLPAARRNSLPQDTLIKCSECGATGHPSCLDLPKKMVAVIKTYPWQCMECKTCVECLDPFDEDKMMFCDRCDRGYHTFCVGLKAIPTGRWECRSCKGTETPKTKRGRH